MVVQQATGTSVGTTETYGLIVVAALVVLRQLLTLLENLDLLRKVREGQERLHHQAFHDWLTGLPNRALFRERLERAVEQHVGGDGRLAVLFFDLDDFKEVNDTLGHAAGDELLKVTAQRLRRGVRDGDTVARLGGDEFAVVLLAAPTDRPGSAQSTCEALLARLGRPVLLAGQQVIPRASAGLFVAEPGERALTAELVLHQADAAMYSAKHAGKGHMVTHVQGGGDPVEDVARMLGRALHAPSAAPAASDPLELVYQPIVRLADGATVAVEALARWQRDPGGVAPEFLVQTAERAGLVERLQDWILARACQDLPVVRAGAWPHLVVHVNVPASLLVSPGLVAAVRQALSDHGVAGSALVLEVTETGRIDDFAAAADILEGVRELGVRVALDDFGAGHSNLNHLLRLPVDILKLDRALRRECGRRRPRAGDQRRRGPHGTPARDPDHRRGRGAAAAGRAAGRPGLRLCSGLPVLAPACSAGPGGLGRPAGAPLRPARGCRRPGGSGLGEARDPHLKAGEPGPGAVDRDPVTERAHRRHPGPTFSTVIPPLAKVMDVAEKSSSDVASGPKVSEPVALIDRLSNSQVTAFPSKPGAGSK